MEQEQPSPRRRALAMASLILAGEAVFIPPFHLGRYFKSSLLGSFGVTELELGEAQALYGVVAMICYVLGGPIADRFAPRTLMAISLLATAGGSLYMATVPSLLGLKLLYAFWGASTILVFWAPLIRATREWGGDPAQGRAFGTLDAGRGLVAALAATAAAFGVAWWFGDDSLADPVKQIQAVRWLSLYYAAICVAAAAAVWCFVSHYQKETDTTPVDPRHGVVADTLWALRQPAVWLQAVVVIAAYSAYKGFSFYGLYSEDACGLSQSESAKLTSWLNYLRVIATLGAGLLADRLGSVATVVAACFAVLLGAFAWLATTPDGRNLFPLVVATIAAASAASYALRGIYFALLKESDVPRRVTGAAVGIVSLVGFTPDVFMPWVSGWLVTSAREAGDVMVGYERFFGLLAVLAAVGLVAAVLLRLGVRADPDRPDAEPRA